MKFKTTFLAIFIASAALFSTSCGSDNDSNEPGSGAGDLSQLTEPKYADDAVKYAINSDKTDIGSIEFTESGRYIIIKSWAMPSNAPKHAKKSMLKAAAGSRYDSNSPYITGTYTKVGDSEYILEGFGSVVITGTSSNAVELLVSPADGEPYSVGAQQEDAINDNSAETLALCRSWNPTQFRARVSVNGKICADESGPYKDLYKIERRIDQILEQLGGYDDDDDEEEYALDDDDYSDEAIATEVIFTRSGSYAVLFDNGELDVRLWKWLSRTTDNLSLIYSWRVDGFSDPEESGRCQVTFNGKSVTFYETESETEDGVTLTIDTWTTVTEKI